MKKVKAFMNKHPDLPVYLGIGAVALVISTGFALYAGKAWADYELQLIQLAQESGDPEGWFKKPENIARYS